MSIRRSDISGAVLVAVAALVTECGSGSTSGCVADVSCVLVDFARVERSDVGRAAPIAAAPVATAVPTRH